MHCSGLASASFDVSSYPEEVGGDFHWSRTWRGAFCSKISTEMGREKIAVAIAMVMVNRVAHGGLRGGVQLCQHIVVPI
jgi:hypothetical protein